MKKLLLSLALVCQVAFVFAQEPIRLKTDKVKLYRQPSNQAEVMKVLNSTEDVMLIRKFDTQWSIVQAGSETGYIHNSRLPKLKHQPASHAAAAQK
jgi:hypothetical protein